MQEDVVTELLEFFEAPQATSDELLADKEVVSCVENSCILYLLPSYVNAYYVCLSISVKQR